jgi:benzoyl-CoA reductase/2-hydroxyglutaryl-CoA dehydratase subunit BcrC/BadD/HgdB
MMKKSYQDAVAFLEKKYEQRPRGFDLFIKELSSFNVRSFDETVKTVYVSGYSFPMELLWAFDVALFDFEIACNLLPVATSGNGSSIMITAENQGYSQDLCSFHRIAIGCMLQGMLPKGDLYITSNIWCHGKSKTNEILARSEGKESLLFEVPNEISVSSVRYVVAQLKEIAARLEVITETRLDLDRLKEAIRWSNRARSSWQEVLDLMKTKPCPWDGARACLLGLGGALLWGSPLRHEINQLLLQEIKERINKGKLFQENQRILWFPWVPVQTTNIFTTLKENQVSVVMAEPACIWWSELDETDPFEALALKSLENLHLGTAEKRVRGLLRLAEEFHVDGAIHFSTPACHAENNSFRLISDALREQGIPAMDLDGDMTDERKYSPDRTLGKLNSFIEVLN